MKKIPIVKEPDAIELYDLRLTLDERDLLVMAIGMATGLSGINADRGLSSFGQRLLRIARKLGVKYD